MVLTILHTNDLHGHLTPWQGWEGDLAGKTIGGFERLASAVACARHDANGEALLLDAGDLLGDSMIADLTRGRAPAAALDALGYDALTIGNHEPDFGMSEFRQLSQKARFHTLAANLVDRRSGALFTEPYVIKVIGGIRVGILGLAYPKTPLTTSASNIATVEFQDPVPAAENYLRRMKGDGASVAIVLSHLGLAGDQHLARAVDGIDVIVGGHSHNRMIDAEKIGSTLIVQAGAHGSDLGRLDLVVEAGRVVDHRRTLIALDHESVVPRHPASERFVDALLAPHRQTLEETIGCAAGWLVRAQTLAGQQARPRDEESPVDALFADILRSRTGADAALLPGVGYGVAIPPGPITAAQLCQLVPHDGSVVTLRLAGSDIAEALEQAVENIFSIDPRSRVGGMIQVSGVSFRYDPNLSHGRRVKQISVGGSDLNRDHRYTVATNSMMAAGGHNYRSLSRAERLSEHGSQYEMIRRWFTDHSSVMTPPCGRIGLMTNAAASRNRAERRTPS